MKNKLMAVLLMVAMVCALPSKAYAADVVVDGTNGNSCSVEAVANVTAEDLADLGLNLIVSLPTEVSMTRSGKNFSGSGRIFAYGFMDSAKTLKITVDEESSAYGVVKYKSGGEGAEAVAPADNFGATVNISLTNGSFTAAQTLANYTSVQNHEDMEHYATLSVAINNMVPTSGVGKYYTDVPLKIAIE